MTTKTRSILISSAVSVLLIFFLFRGLDWDSLLQNLSQVQLLPVVGLLVLFWISLEIRAVRWRYLLPSNLVHPRDRLFNCVSIGFFATAVLPLRAGEIIRPWLYSKKRADLSFSAAFASIVIERVFDTVAILALFAWVLGARDDLPELLLLGVYSLMALVLVLVMVTMVAYFKPATVLSVFKFVSSFVKSEKLQGVLHKIEEILDEFLSGLRAISDGRELFLSVFWTIVLWLEVGLIYQLGMYAMGQEGSFDLGITVSVVIALAVAAPSAPGFIGTFQAGCVLALSTFYGFDREFALSYSIVIHALQFFATLLVGMVALHREGLSFAELLKEKKG